jgi:hypothetical protein
VKLIRPITDPSLSYRSRQGRVRPTRVPVVKPQWLRDWIAEQGQFVLLSCGHKDNLNDRSLIIIAALSGTKVWCDRCETFAAVIRHMRIHEYAGLPPKEVSDIPLF